MLNTAVNLAPLPGTGGTAPSVTLGVNTVLWEALTVNARGQTELSRSANSVDNRASFEPQSGRLHQLSAGKAGEHSGISDVINHRYGWDSTNQLTRRVDALGDGSSGIEVQDTFAYDAIGRLSSYTVSGGGSGSPMSRSVELRYNALGMLLYKSDVGYYSYGAQATGVQPHALKSVAFTGSPATSSAPAIEPYTTQYGYDLNGNLKTGNVGRYTTLAYTSFNLPDAQNGINGPSGATANPLPRYTWQYDENHQRVKETRINASGTRITWMLHPDNQGGAEPPRVSWSASGLSQLQGLVC